MDNGGSILQVGVHPSLIAGLCHLNITCENCEGGCTPLSLDQIPPNKWLSYSIFGSVGGSKNILFLLSSPYITMNLNI